MRFAWVYEALTGKTLKGVPAGQDEAMILALLYKIANGEISLPDENKTQTSNVPTNLDELWESYQKTMDGGNPVDRQVIRAVIEAWIKMRKEERLAKVLEGAGVERQKIAGVMGKIIPVLEKTEGRGGDRETVYKTIEEVAQKEGLVLPNETKTLLYETYHSGLLPKNLVERLGVFVQRPRPAPTPENPKIENGGNLRSEVKREPGEIKKLELLVRLSYKRPSVVNEIVNELAQIPLNIPASFGATQLLLHSGIGPETLRVGIEEFKRQNQGIDSNHPFIRALFSQLSNLEELAVSNDKLAWVLEKYKNEVQIEILLLEKEGEFLDTPTQKYIRFEVYQPKREGPLLRPIVPPPTGDGYWKIGGQEALKITQKNLLSTVAKIIAKPFSLLNKARGYLGGVLMAGALILPLPAPLRAAVAIFGFSLGWKQVSSFFTSVLPGLLKNLRKISFSLLVSRGVGGLLSAIFTKPALGWLRLALAGGFGLGAFFLPIPLPLRVVFGGIGGSFGAMEAVRSFPKAAFPLLRGAIAVGRVVAAITAATGVPTFLLVVVIGVFVLLGVLGIITISTSQGLYLTAGTAGAPATESRYIGITKVADPPTLKNTDLPKAINFTITITAKEQVLTITSIKETFAVLVKDKAVSIPEKILTASKTKLARGEATEIKFALELDKSFEDSVVTTTTIVSASVDSQVSPQTTSASTPVVVGSPPTSCIVFDNSRLPWQDGTQPYMSWAIQAIAYISQSQTYAANLCGRGPVFLERGRSSLDVGDKDDVAGLAPAALGNRVYLFDKAFTGYLQLRYVLAHELGHVYAYRNGDVFRLFERVVNPQDPKNGEAFLKTYPLTKSVGEDFPETIALYIVWETTSIGNYGIINIPMEYPKHHTFARQQIFGLFEYK